MRHFAVVEQRSRLAKRGDLHLDLSGRALEVGDERVGDTGELGVVQAGGRGNLVVSKPAQHQVSIGNQSAQAGPDDQEWQQQHERQADQAPHPGDQVGRDVHTRRGAVDSCSHAPSGA